MPEFTNPFALKTMLPHNINVQRRSLVDANNPTTPKMKELNCKFFLIAVKSNYIALVDAHCRENPTVGSPIYNYRTFPDGAMTKYRAQLIIGGSTWASAMSETQELAQMEAAKTAYHALYPIEAQESAELESEPVISPSKRDRLPDGHEGVYYSDTEEIPSYNHFVLEFCTMNNIPPPTFRYQRNDTKTGYRCSVSVHVEDNPFVTCLRDHKYKENAKEDACHDMFILLQSLQTFSGTATPRNEDDDSTQLNNPQL